MGGGEDEDVADNDVVDVNININEDDDDEDVDEDDKDLEEEELAPVHGDGLVDLGDLLEEPDEGHVPPGARVLGDPRPLLAGLDNLQPGVHLRKGGEERKEREEWEERGRRGGRRTPSEGGSPPWRRQ